VKIIPHQHTRLVHSFIGIAFSEKAKEERGEEYTPNSSQLYLFIKNNHLDSV
jgi:hypothetical protein